jgi:ADP-ribosylglycohydrolase
MLGAIIGDIIGSTYEFNNTKNYNFELFAEGGNYTDDTICTIAVADAILNEKSFEDAIRYWCQKYPYPKGGYGASFAHWVHSPNPKPYGSFGNGSAMRVSPCGWLPTEQEVLKYARLSAECTHNHPEGIKGAECVAHCVYLARTENNKDLIINTVQDLYSYDLSQTYEEIRATNTFNETCQVTVPQAIVCFLESHDFESAIRLAVSIGGDSDTIATITGSIAEAFYGIPDELAKKAESYLTDEMLNILSMFKSKISHSTQVALSEEAIKLRELHSSLRNNYSELYMAKQNMLQHEKPLLTALYLDKIGHKLYRNFCLSIELKQLQYRLSLLQAYVNRNEAPNLKAVEQEVKTQFEAYNRQIEAEAERLAAASRFLSGGFLSKEDSKKLRVLYYFIVKRLHPDVNANLSEKEKELFLQAQIAYELADLKALQQIVLLLEHDSIETKSIELIPLKEIIRKLEENIETLEKQISELESEFPFIYREKIYNNEWVASEIVTIEKEINELNTEIEKYKTYITLLEEWKPE